MLYYRPHWALLIVDVICGPINGSFDAVVFSTGVHFKGCDSLRFAYDLIRGQKLNPQSIHSSHQKNLI